MKKFEPKQLLMIDANNLCYRVCWSHRHLTFQGQPVSLLYGFLKSLVWLKKKYSDWSFLIVWDYKSKRRIEESQKGVAEGIIPSAYKETRPDKQQGDVDDAIIDMFEQIDELRSILSMVDCQQVAVKDFEADDVIYTYAMLNRDAGGKSLIVTSDKDYYQMLLDDSVAVFDVMKRNFWTKEKVIEEHGVSLNNGLISVRSQVTVRITLSVQMVGETQPRRNTLKSMEALKVLLKGFGKRSVSTRFLRISIEDIRKARIPKTRF